MENKKPECQLIGTDGNVFALAARVCSALRKAGQSDKVKEFTERLFRSKSYDDALVLMGEYVEVA